MQPVPGMDVSIGQGHPMAPWIKHAPTIITVGMIVILALHGRIAQPAHYNEFADQSAVRHSSRRRCVVQRGVRPGRDLGLADIAAPTHQRPFARRMARLQAVPDRTVPDRVRVRVLSSRPRQYPPDLGQAADRAGLRRPARGRPRRHLGGSRTWFDAIVLGLCAVASVAWWAITDRNGAGDLRPYLLLQGLALILIPLWQAIHRAPRTDRIAFGTAMVLYILAKSAEVLDHEIANAFGFVTGHTLKHLIATAATAAVVWGLIRRSSHDGHAAHQVDQPTCPR